MYYDMGVGVINKRLNSKTEGSKLLLYTGLCKGRGYLKIETMLKGKRFESVRCECDLDVISVSSKISSASHHH